MLPIELIDILWEYLDLEEIVALSQTSTSWKHAIPEYNYQHKLETRCPSFTPMNSSRESWEECARVHIARLKNPKWMKNEYLFGIKGTISAARVTHNTAVPADFESFTEGYEQSISSYSATFFSVIKGSVIKYLSGNRIEIDNTVFFLGVNGEIERETGANKAIDELATSMGTKMVRGPQWEENTKTSIVVKNDDAVAISTTSRVVGVSEDDLWQ